MTTCNGIEIEQIQQFTQLLTADPRAGRTTLRTRHHWDSGYAVEAVGDELRVAGQTIPRSHTVISDRPAPFGGDDRGCAPGELVLAALAACITSQFVEQASARKVELGSIEVTCEGHLDLRGSLGIGDARPGLERIEVQVAVTATPGDEILGDLLDLAVRTSPVADSLSGRVAIVPTLQGAPSLDPAD